jgi:hypothetical protein
VRWDIIAMKFIDTDNIQWWDLIYIEYISIDLKVAIDRRQKAKTL